MSYALVHKQLGDDLWGTITGAFTGATSAAKTGASAAWTTLKHYNDPSYQADLKKQKECQSAGGGLYYDPIRLKCVGGTVADQKKSCEDADGQFFMSVDGVWGCYPNNLVPQKQSGKSSCDDPRSIYDADDAVRMCGKRPYKTAFKQTCNESGGTTVWIPKTSAESRQGQAISVPQGYRCMRGITIVSEDLAGTSPQSSPATWVHADGTAAAAPQPLPVSTSDVVYQDTQQQGTQSWWSQRSAAEKAGMIGGAAVLGLGAIWLIAR